MLTLTRRMAGALLALLLPLAACDTSNFVGASCANDLDCAEFMTCLTGPDYPGGMCTTACETTPECPTGSWCSKDDGVCLPECEADDDCRPGYVCDALAVDGDPDPRSVCVADTEDQRGE